jgi:hypothetical protein
MKTPLICMAVLVGQLAVGQMVTLQNKPVVHLHPHNAGIRVEFGGKLLELIGAPDVVFLPISALARDVRGAPWSVDIKNLGPSAVVVATRANLEFALTLARSCVSGRTVPHIC